MLDTSKLLSLKAERIAFDMHYDMDNLKYVCFQI